MNKVMGSPDGVEGATGPDRELDVALWVGLGATAGPWETLELNGWTPTNGALTGSLDAAVALVERMLPGWGWSVRTQNYSGTDNPTPAQAAVWPGSDDWRSRRAKAKATALALVLAVLYELRGQAGP